MPASRKGGFLRRGPFAGGPQRVLVKAEGNEVVKGRVGVKPGGDFGESVEEVVALGVAGQLRMEGGLFLAGNAERS